MKTWSVTGKVWASKYLGVFEAETVEEAIEKALASDAAFVAMCHQCASECSDPQIEEAEASEIEAAEGKQ